MCDLHWPDRDLVTLIQMDFVFRIGIVVSLIWLREMNEQLEKSIISLLYIYVSD